MRLVQVDSSLPLHTLGELVGLSGPAVQRRLVRLRRDGVISNTVAIVNATTVGLDLTVIVHIYCERDTPDATARLESSLAALRDAKHVYRVTGDHDFTAVLAVPDMERYNEIVDKVFSADPNVRSYETHVALKTIRDTHQLPV